MAIATALDKIKNDYMEDVNNKMLELLISGEYYDCTVEVGNNPDPPQFFKCHRVILSLASDVFFNYFKDDKIQKDDSITCFEKFSSEIVEAALRFVYGCDTETLNNDLVFNVDLIKFTSKWNMLKLREITAWNCLNSFDLSVNDLLWLHFLFAFYQDMTNEKERTMRLISRRGGEVLKSMHQACEGSSFFDNLEDTIKAIFKEKYINIGSEKDFLDALTRWGEAQVGGAEEMSTAIRVKVSELLKMVRFKAFTARDFAQLFMDNSSILTPQEKMSIFSFVHTQQGPLLESLIGFDLNSGWRGRFHPDTKIVLLTSNDVKDDNQNRQWLAPKRNTYLLSVGVDASKYLKVNKKLYIKIGINGVKSVDDGTIATFDSSFFSGSDNMEQNNKMIRLTMPYLLKNRFIYTVYVTESNQPTERLRKCEFGSDLNVTFPGIQIDWIMWSGGMGEIIAYEFGRPISPSEME